MTGLAALTQATLVRTFALTRIGRQIHLYPFPLFDAICNPFRIRLVKSWSTYAFAGLTALIIDPGIVFCSRILPYSNANTPARPTAGCALLVVAYKAAGYGGIVLLNTSIGVIDLMEPIGEEMLLEQS